MKLDKKINFKISKESIHYDTAIDEMKKHLSLMKSGHKDELIWFLEHDNIFTAGTSAKIEDQQIINPNLIRYTGRGGQWTWHGKGQRVVYIMLDLKKREKDVRKFVRNLEYWIISSLETFSLNGLSFDQYPGVWIKKNNNFYKIASIGIRISNWITWHGISINLNPNLDYFKQILPCGIRNAEMTSLKNEGININIKQLDNSLIKNIQKFF